MCLPYLRDIFLFVLFTSKMDQNDDNKKKYSGFPRKIKASLTHKANNGLYLQSKRSSEKLYCALSKISQSIYDPIIL